MSHGVARRCWFCGAGTSIAEGGTSISGAVACYWCTWESDLIDDLSEVEL